MRIWKRLACAMLALAMTPSLSACGSSAAKEVELIIFAAASMQETLTEIGENYKKDHPNVNGGCLFHAGNAPACDGFGECAPAAHGAAEGNMGDPAGERKDISGHTPPRFIAVRVEGRSVKRIYQQTAPHLSDGGMPLSDRWGAFAASGECFQWAEHKIFCMRGGDRLERARKLTIQNIGPTYTAEESRRVKREIENKLYQIFSQYQSPRK